MLLSEAYEKYKKEPIHYAVCRMCNTAWIDDMPHIGSLTCPKCPQQGVGLLRGFKDLCSHEQLDNAEDEPENPTNDPGKQARSLASVKSRDI